MSDRVFVCGNDALEENDRLIVDIDEEEVAVMRIEGDIYAVQNRCPHRGAPVSAGDVSHEISAEQEKLGKRYDEVFTDNLVLTCPWHGYEFDLETGEHAGHCTPQLTTLDVVVDDGDIYVEP